MYEIFDGITNAWSEVKHISEITGLSVAALIGCAAVVYLDPTARKFAIRTAVLVAVGYWGFIFAYHQGNADKKAECDAADASRAQQFEQRDKRTNMAITAQYDLKIMSLQKINAAQQQQIDSYEHKLLAAKSGGACPLGNDALRLRNHAK